MIWPFNRSGLVCALIVLATITAMENSIAAEAQSDTIAYEISDWFVNEFGKFNLAAIQPIDHMIQSRVVAVGECGHIYNGPIPSSSFRTAVIVDCASKISLLLYGETGAAADSLVFEGVAPGWYALLIGAGPPLARVQLKFDGELVEDWEQVFK